MISIATTYFNRKTQFINTLKSLTLSRVKDFELIAVDDCSDEEERIEDLEKDFSFLKVYRIGEKEKRFNNPCIAFNLAFSKCSGDTIIIQNAECFHYTDILHAVREKISEDKYLSLACYSIDQETTERISIDFLNSFKTINFLPRRQDINGLNGWYNHGLYRPTGLHFCSAISRKNLIKLNGFDERYAEGSCFDDNEFLHRIGVLGLKIIFENEQVSVHQYHPNFNYHKPNISAMEHANQNLYRNTTLKENIYKANPLKSILKEI